MNRYEKYGLSDQDLSLFRDYVDAYCSDDCQVLRLRIPVEDYLAKWETAKSKKLFSIFGNKLIHKESVCFKTPKSVIENKIDEEFFGDFKNDVLFPIRDIIGMALLDHTGYWYSDDSEEKFKEVQFCYQVFHKNLFCPSTFVDNKCYTPARYENKELLPHSFSISKNQKPFKAIKSIIKTFYPIAQAKNPFYFDAKFLNDLNKQIEHYRIKQSQILNRTTLKGDLCLSIHPLDYITASDNNYDWDSCMSWTDGDDPGEFRLGTVEMMNSPIVVVAYLEGSLPYYPVGDNRAWSNKKWREFFIVDRNIISSIRGYPYQALDLEQMVIKKLASMAESAGYPKYQEEIQCGRTVNIGSHPVQFNTNNMYNDTDYWDKQAVCSSEPTTENFSEDDSSYLINYSGIPLCVTCGRPFSRTNEEAQKLNCEECEGGYRCVDCHSIIYEDDEAFDIGGKTYCCNCGVTCPICNRDFPIEETQTAYIQANHDGGRNIHEFVKICEDCIKDVRPFLHELTKKEIGDLYFVLPGTLAFSSLTPDKYANEILDKMITDWGYEDLRSGFKIQDFWI